MKAAVLVETGQPLVVDDLTLPELGVGQVLVRMQYAAICGAQLGEIAAVKGPDKYLPHLLGHEGVGTVEAIGLGVTTKAVGDRVICHWRPSEGIAAKGPVYDWLNQIVDAGPMACFAEQCIVSENRLTLCPDGLDPRLAPLFGCAVTTAYGVVTNDAHVKPGEAVVVFGCGGVGLPMIQMAKLAGAYPIYGVDPVAIKREMAVALGADAVVGRYDEALWPMDVAIDTTGQSSAIECAYRIAQRVLLVGVPHHDDPIRIDSLPLHFNKVLKGSQGGDCQPHLDIPRLAKLVLAGRLDLSKVVTHTVPFAQINDALDLVRRGQAGRVLLEMAA